MNKLIITVILFVTLVVPALAQDTTKPEATAEATSEATVEATEVLDGPKPDKDNPFYCEGAQEWFDEAIEYVVTMLDGIQMVSPASSARDLRVAFMNMLDAYIEAEAVEYPECVEVPRDDLLTSYLYFIMSVDEFSKTDNQFAAIGPAVKGWRHLGRSQGYLAAIGVNSDFSYE